MKLILHIGMGKTGTSSIQNALRTSSAELAEQKVQYLGMWFDAIDPTYKGHAGLHQFLDLECEKFETAALVFLNYLHDQSFRKGTKTFILSNEGLFGEVHKITPFLKALEKQVNLTLILYIRDPQSWLPSAYTQWSLHHKTLTGPLQGFAQHAPILLSMYQNIAHWLKHFPDNLITRRHKPSENVIDDFSEACGITITSDQERVLDRSEPIETLLRAAFNARYGAAVLPERFNRLVIPSGLKVNSISQLAETCFNFEGLEQIISDQKEIFEQIEENLGSEFDFLEKQEIRHRIPDPIELQSRLLDYLVEITFLQAERIKRLENQMLEIQKNQ